VKIVSGILELFVVLCATLLIKWGAMDASPDGSDARDRRRMSVMGFFLLVSWIVMAGIPNFIKHIREDSELAKLKKSGYFHPNGNGHSGNSADDRKLNGKKRRKRF
jgi:hypothetical protein